MPEVGVVELADLIRALFDQHLFVEAEQIGGVAARQLPPAIEMLRRYHLLADALVIKVEQGFIIHEDVAAARFMLEIFDFAAQLLVIAEEGVARLPVALHQRMADKQLAAQRRVDAAIVDLTRGDDRQAVQRDLLLRHHRALAFFPVRLAVAAFDQVLRQRLDPFGIDARRDASPQAAGFHQLRHHGPFGRLFEQPGSGKDSEARVARAGKLLLFGVFNADMR